MIKNFKHVVIFCGRGKFKYGKQHWRGNAQKQSILIEVPHIMCTKFPPVKTIQYTVSMYTACLQTAVVFHM